MSTEKTLKQVIAEKHLHPECDSWVSDAEYLAANGDQEVEHRISNQEGEIWVFGMGAVALVVPSTGLGSLIVTDEDWIAEQVGGRNHEN